MLGMCGARIFTKYKLFREYVQIFSRSVVLYLLQLAAGKNTIVAQKFFSKCLCIYRSTPVPS